ncbi:MAG TPA: XRE family transcriptional regulator [Patescibacteria group bacterium]|nr:XRE family transcriptional regulator [Patescibacteria group bacterium]
MSKPLGQKIKEVRRKNKMTLKDLSQQAGLSIGYLSQLERGLTDIATDSLANVARVLGVDFSHFFSSTQPNYRRLILRSYEKTVSQVDQGHFIHYHLTDHAAPKLLLPRLLELVPINSNEVISSYPHEGEEFIYVLEGTLTLFIDKEQQELYPGDSAHFESTQPHNWVNYTNKMVRILVVSIPNPFREPA